MIVIGSKGRGHVCYDLPCERLLLTEEKKKEEKRKEGERGIRTYIVRAGIGNHTRESYS
jgi:hypothetical protein